MTQKASNVKLLPSNFIHVYPAMLYQTRHGAIIAKMLTTCCATNFNSNSRWTESRWANIMDIGIRLQRNSFCENLWSLLAESKASRRINKVSLMHRFKWMCIRKEQFFRIKTLNDWVEFLSYLIIVNIQLYSVVFDYIHI